MQVRDGRTCRCECHQAPERVLVTEQAELVEVEYRSPEWYAARREGISASEIAAVMGLSPWVSRFDLWWLKRTGDDSQAEDGDMRRGRRYESLVIEDFAEEHPEFHVGPSVTVRSIERPWQVATPDGLVYEQPYAYADPEERKQPVAVIEAKTGQRSEWGEPGTDDIPVQYRCQVLWQMDTLGLSVAYLPVFFGFAYAEYVVTYDETDVLAMREAAQAFLADVREDRVPDIDAHTATTRRLKRLHPSVEEGEVEVPAAVVGQYRTARALRDATESRMRLAENRIRHALGSRQIAVVDGVKVASRSVYDVKPRVQEVKGYTVNRLNFTKPKSTPEKRSLS